jgi:hypothetical protein
VTMRDGDGFAALSDVRSVTSGYHYIYSSVVSAACELAIGVEGIDCSEGLSLGVQDAYVR